MIISAMIFALGFAPVALHAGLTGSKESNSMAGEYKSAKGGEWALEYQARRIIGTYVENQKGDYFGRITDLMIAPQGSGITFAVISRGGVLGIPMRFAAVPFSALTFSREKNVYLLDVSKEKIDEAPAFSRYGWPNVANAGWEKDIYRYYGQTPNWGETNMAASNSTVLNKSKAFDFNKIVGEPVKNQQGEKLGEIRDLVIDSEGHVPLAILSHGGFWGIDKKLAAVPFSALNLGQMGKEFVLNSTKENLDSAPSFQVSDLSNEKWVEDVYRLFGQHPYWTE